MPIVLVFVCFVLFSHFNFLLNVSFLWLARFFYLLTNSRNTTRQRTLACFFKFRKCVCATDQLLSQHKSKRTTWNEHFPETWHLLYHKTYNAIIAHDSKHSASPSETISIRSSKCSMHKRECFVPVTRHGTGGVDLNCNNLISSVCRAIFFIKLIMPTKCFGAALFVLLHEFRCCSLLLLAMSYTLYDGSCLNGYSAH